jgi:hypothetical protein
VLQRPDYVAGADVGPVDHAHLVAGQGVRLLDVVGSGCA